MEGRLQDIDAAECLRLLAAAGVGRIALPGHGVPEIRPVNFVLREQTVIMRTAEGALLDAARAALDAAFEVDAIDRLEHTGWSVIATGPLHELPADAGMRALPLRAWAAGGRDRFVGLVIKGLSGRRIVHGSRR